MFLIHKSIKWEGEKRLTLLKVLRQSSCILNAAEICDTLCCAYTFTLACKVCQCFAAICPYR